MSESIDAKVVAALDRDFDPCSIAAKAPVSILDMGLVQDWEVDEEGHLIVRMCLTSASCTMSPNMVRAAEEQLSAIPELRSVRVEIDPSLFWTPDQMTARGKSTLHMRRTNSMAKTGVVPQQWRKAAL
jgi:metal-sulfur cluster biosynthetic enzyme